MNRLDPLEGHLGYLGKKVAPSATNPLKETLANLNRLDIQEPSVPGISGEEEDGD
jgi:hypothetical protein